MLIIMPELFPNVFALSRKSELKREIAINYIFLTFIHQAICIKIISLHDYNLLFVSITDPRTN